MEDKIKNFEPVEEIVIDFGDICRFCLEDTNNAVRISDNCFSKDGKDLTIAKFVEKLTTIQVRLYFVFVYFFSFTFKTRKEHFFFYFRYLI